MTCRPASLEMGNATTMMKSNGPSHLVGHKSANEDRYSLEGKQCVCAEVISVYEIMKPRTPSPLTWPASLEKCCKHDYTHHPVNEKLRCYANNSKLCQLLGFH